MYILRRLTIFAICLAIFIFLASFLPRALNPVRPSPEQERRDRIWVDSSPYWLDRQACRWLSLCGIHHVRWDPAALPQRNASDPDDDGELRRLELRSLWESSQEDQPQSKRWEHATRRRNVAPTMEERSPNGTLQEIPDYVLAHAPLVHLYTGENFWPADIAEHIQHMAPYTNGSPLNDSSSLNLRELYKLNAHKNVVYLTSEDNAEDRPEWLHYHAGDPSPFEFDGGDEQQRPATGDVRIPTEKTTWYNVDRDHPLHRISDPRNTGRKSSEFKQRVPEHLHKRMVKRRASDSQHPLPQGIQAPPTPNHKPDSSGYSKGPAVLVMVDKGSGIVDAFWFFFYSYNLGQTVWGVRYGNHIGDWEHCMIRFENGVPRALFLSEHEGGQAYAWSALEKYRPQQSDGSVGPERPVIYSGVGSHAMYALSGNHPYVLPFQMLKDVTDNGPVWDPAKNNYAYFYDYVLDRDQDQSGKEEPTSLTPAASNPNAATGWFHYAGPWGDELYDLGDKRQWRLFGQYHYVTGPLGPKFKNLDRAKVCQTTRCRILYSLDAGKKGTWYN